MLLILFVDCKTPYHRLFYDKGELALLFFLLMLMYRLLKWFEMP